MKQQKFDSKDSAVIVVDVQADFTESRSGTLAVPGTDNRYLDAVVRATRELSERGFPVFFTQDWHPGDHISFYTNHPGAEPFETVQINGRTQVLWPPHCVQETPGAEILIPAYFGDRIVRKGTDPRFDSYSGFADDGGKPTDLNDLLQREGIKKVIVYGLATDFCVKATVMDALKNGYSVQLFLDLCRGVSSATTETAVAELQQHRIMISHFDLKVA